MTKPASDGPQAEVQQSDERDEGKEHGSHIESEFQARGGSLCGGVENVDRFVFLILPGEVLLRHFILGQEDLRKK